jgi:ketosteroid isomerase-like protein
MRAAAGLCLVVLAAVCLGACGSSDKQSSAAVRVEQRDADYYAIDQIEKVWHQAASTHDVNEMMSIWAPNATFNIGTATLSGAKQIRNFFATKAAPFQPQNHWVSDTPAYKIRITVNGDKGTLYFECHYIDVKTKKVAVVVGADQNVQKINGKWLITNAAAATPSLAP